MLGVHASLRPHLILAYFGGPDREAHFDGMESAQTQLAVRESDAQVGRVLDAIEALPFTTDHGMLPVTYNVNVSRILANHGISARYRSSGTTSFLYFDDPAQADEAVAQLSGYEEFDAVRKAAQPALWHLGGGPRVGDVVLSAKPPYFIEDISRWPRWVRWLGTWGPEFLWAGFTLKATHGYPPDTPGVEGVLYAWGAGIPPGRELASVRAVDIHPTVTRLLGIQAGKPVDGTVARELLERYPD
jgi:arylsulfatase A-like enzyme